MEMEGVGRGRGWWQSWWPCSPAFASLHLGGNSWSSPSDLLCVRTTSLTRFTLNYVKSDSSFAFKNHTHTLSDNNGDAREAAAARTASASPPPLPPPGMVAHTAGLPPSLPPLTAPRLLATPRRLRNRRLSINPLIFEWTCYTVLFNKKC